MSRRRIDWRAVTYLAVLLVLGVALVWGILNCGCPEGA
ncbi:hypothetical protein QF032_001399 [Streptomyces achromogenes]|nr:hypothetical protein [Streptomyces achromogenes]